MNKFDRIVVEGRNRSRKKSARKRLRNGPRRRPPRELLRPERGIRGVGQWTGSLWFRRYLRRPRCSRFRWTSFLPRVVQGYDTHTWRAANIRKQGAAKCVEIDPRFLDPRFSLFRTYEFTATSTWFLRESRWFSNRHHEGCLIIRDYYNEVLLWK